jgi:hypothetical protein
LGPDDSVESDVLGQIVVRATLDLDLLDAADDRFQIEDTTVFEITHAIELHTGELWYLHSAVGDVNEYFELCRDLQETYSPVDLGYRCTDISCFGVQRDRIRAAFNKSRELEKLAVEKLDAGLQQDDDQPCESDGDDDLMNGNGATIAAPTGGGEQFSGGGRDFSEVVSSSEGGDD